MAELKTKPTQASVEDFLNAIQDEQSRQDCQTIAEMMERATNSKPQMWGSSIVGFGNYHYKYASGKGGDWMLIAFSLRKQNISLYIMGGFEEYEKLAAQLGKITRGKGCLYIKRLSQVDLSVLEKLMQASVEHLRASYPPD